jgi:hypothetical protein
MHYGMSLTPASPGAVLMLQIILYRNLPKQSKQRSALIHPKLFSFLGQAPPISCAKHRSQT